MTSHKAASGYYGDGGMHNGITVIQSKISPQVELHVYNDRSGCMFSLLGVILSEYELNKRGYGAAINEIKPQGYHILRWDV